MIDHVSVTVSDYARAKAFYEKALAPLGYAHVMEFDGVVGGFAVDNKPDFWIEQSEGKPSEIHLAFAAKTRAAVDAFHAAALAAGAQDNGKPGIREEYHPNYYGAFAIDLDGHNIEAVCHKPE